MLVSTVATAKARLMMLFDVDLAYKIEKNRNKGMVPISGQSQKVYRVFDYHIPSRNKIACPSKSDTLASPISSYTTRLGAL